MIDLVWDVFHEQFIVSKICDSTSKIKKVIDLLGGIKPSWAILGCFTNSFEEPKVYIRPVNFNFIKMYIVHPESWIACFKPT